MPFAAHDGPRQPGFLLLGLWFGLLTGLGEVGLLALRKLFYPRFVHLSLDAAWMAPLVNVVLFVVTAIVLVLMARRWPRLVRLPSVIFVLALLSYLSLLLLAPRLHRYAMLLLVAGLAAQTARVLSAHSRGFHTLVRRTVVGLVAVVLAIAVIVPGWSQVALRRAIANLPPAAPGAPNVLLIVLDTVRAKSLSAYGYDRPTTPELERWAKGGVVFETAISTAPWTLPSHAGMFTGHYPHRLSLDWITPLGRQHPTLAEVLSEQGYLTAGFVANTFMCSWESGLGRGFAHYEDFIVSPGEIVRSSSLGRALTGRDWFRRVSGYREMLGRKTAERVNRDFLRWLSRNDERPFFAFLNYFDAHTPYLPPEPFAARFRREPRSFEPWHGTPRQWRPHEVRGEQDAYDDAIAYIDHHLGLLLAELGRRGVLDHTLVIVTSDHGEHFHEHGFMGHGNSLYLPELHVPLIVHYPSRVPAGERIVEPVTLRDLPATVVDLLQIEGQGRFPGETLARHWNRFGRASLPAGRALLSEVSGENSLPSWYPASKGDMKSILIHPYHYVKNGHGDEELYDIERDPEQRQNLARTEGGGLLDRFGVMLKQMIEDPR